MTPKTQSRCRRVKAVKPGTYMACRKDVRTHACARAHTHTHIVRRERMRSMIEHHQPSNVWGMNVDADVRRRKREGRLRWNTHTHSHTDIVASGREEDTQTQACAIAGAYAILTRHASEWRCHILRGDIYIWGGQILNDQFIRTNSRGFWMDMNWTVRWQEKT